MKRIAKRAIAAVAALTMAVSFSVAVQASTPTYVFDASGIPPQYQTGDMRSMQIVGDDNPITDMAGVEVRVAPGASQPDLTWYVRRAGGGAVSLRPGGPNCPNETTNLLGGIQGTEGFGWVDANGMRRVFETSVPLSGPIRVDIVAEGWAGPALIPLFYGDEMVELIALPRAAADPPRTMHTVSHVFESGSGLVSIGRVSPEGTPEDEHIFWSWGPSGSEELPGRLVVRSISITENYGGAVTPPPPAATPAPPAATPAPPPVGGEVTPPPAATPAPPVGQVSPDTNDTNVVTYVLIGGAVVALAALVIVKKRKTA